ncbi:hypothetical protein BDA96_03G074000 [Sorghum bicolor]|jgi:hypothetical protein|uniref:Uncharacterized protein n=2 Tax=Sorghum bicolor TaxID=4558 RepID=C5XPZ3_SORBI|nr:uncharacterized protein LOC8060793 [Sorghum bicolor]EES00314.1 hypothetical protein SORBI_3003G070500 [Sorghum bicolor]KAG0536552.1 hypothetical protein BDA96_03G074000 [Sorghum bicolor]|eukprot:XP_002455194.1 uncharacterized protein LOC8060793 [Sorghum bicolor]
MAFPSLSLSLAGLLARRALLLYAAAWTAVATTAVAVAAFAPELAFVWAVGPWAPLSRACPAGTTTGGDDSVAFTVGLPLDGPPWDAVCVPAGMLGRAKPDVIVPLVFAVVVVTGAVWFTTAVGVWEDEHDDEPSSPAAFLEQV